MIERNRLVKLTQQLIRIPSENPPGNEQKISCFVKNYLSDLGLKPKIYEFKKNRSNVVAILKGKNKNRSLLVTPHLDTVSAGGNWRFPPFAAKLHKGRVYGCGASDDKGNLAVILEVIRSIVKEKQNLNYDLIFAATADEESGSIYGIIPLIEKGVLKPQAALILDADEFKIIVAQKGLLHLKVKLEGKSAHAAFPERGKNAIELALKVLNEIKSHKFSHRKNPYLRPPTINIGRITGGDKVNVVADWCEFELDFRFLPGMSAKRAAQDMEKIIKNYTKGYKIEIMAVQSPTQVDRRHPLVEHLKRSMAAYKVKPRISGSEGATVITFFKERNIPAVATGFGCLGCAHSSNEYIKSAYLYKGAKVLENFLKNYAEEYQVCKKAPAG